MLIRAPTTFITLPFLLYRKYLQVHDRRHAHAGVLDGQQPESLQRHDPGRGARAVSDREHYRPRPFPVPLLWAGRFLLHVSIWHHIHHIHHTFVQHHPHGRAVRPAEGPAEEAARLQAHRDVSHAGRGEVLPLLLRVPHLHHPGSHVPRGDPVHQGARVGLPGRGAHHRDAGACSFCCCSRYSTRL